MIDRKSSTPLPIRRAIEIAHRQGARELDLSRGGETLNIHLHNLPKEVLGMERLERLNLSHNALQSLPETLNHMPRLRVLDIRDNPIRRLPDGPLPGLIVDTLQLELWGDLFQGRALHGLQILPRHRKRLAAYLDRWGEQLHELDLSDCRLGELPAYITRLTGLTSLKLWSNQLGRLPDDIAQLTRLTALDLAGNRLNTLPDGMARLTALTTLNLAGNELATLPADFAQLGALTSLDLSYNQFQALPESLEQLPTLIALNLKGNPLRMPPGDPSRRFTQGGQGGLANLYRWTDRKTRTIRPALSA